jgi:hypothetical protein
MKPVKLKRSKSAHKNLVEKMLYVFKELILNVNVNLDLMEIHTQIVMI